MGYYDKDYSRDATPGKQKGNRKNFRKGLFTGVIGAIIGALIILFAAPLLAKSGLLPNAASGVVQEDDKKLNNGEPDVTMQKQVNLDLNSAVVKAVDKASDAVVSVINLAEANFNDNRYTQNGIGSGVIYKKEKGKAYVATNHHVVSRANKIEIRLGEDTKVQAKLLGSDPLMDLAVLQIDAEKVKTVAELGNSEKLKLGEPVMAIGNPLGFSGSVTQGIVSSADRVIPRDFNNDRRVDWRAEVIQSDAAINPGNSGGALVNVSGQVIGINSLKIAEKTVEGIGFAIPINVAKPIIQELEEFGEVRRPKMGIYLESLAVFPSIYTNTELDLPENVDTGVVILEVIENSPADRAGLSSGDVIVSINGEKIEDTFELRKYLYRKSEIGDTIKVTIYREKDKQTVSLTLTERQE